MSVRAMVLRAAGTNCDRESVHAVELAGGTADRVHVNTLCAKPAMLDAYALLVLPGGFSYGDDVAAGRLFGNQLKLRCGDALERFIAKGGVAIGICNGFQVLIGAGLLPGGDLSHKVTLSLNASGKFEDRWVWCETPATHSPLLEEGERVLLPVANAEGRILTDGDATTAALTERRHVAFRYVDANGGAVGYPGNPNGSVDAIAGLVDDTGRILGLMPHPERIVDPTQHPRWTRGEVALDGEGDGLRYFRRAIAVAK